MIQYKGTFHNFVTKYPIIRTGITEISIASVSGYVISVILLLVIAQLYSFYHVRIKNRVIYVAGGKSGVGWTPTLCKIYYEKWDIDESLQTTSKKSIFYYIVINSFLVLFTLMLFILHETGIL